ncbi:ATP-binding protein, partial [Zoogloea sp.]|uniref:ATP-binding response regulator n=1 Tax=Zoogloea sp. TaxID=49181 RepID=UPI002BAA3011
PVLLDRILLNLLANAIRHTVRGGVLVGVRRRGREARIEVWDTGPGIPEEFRREVFREFFQLGHGERDRTKGLGLGLAIVERTARLLDHPVGLHSRVGRGSVFSLRVPLAEPGSEGDGAGMAGTEDMSAMDVAVVDDDPLVRQAMQAVLAGWGCRVFAGAGGEEVLKALADAGAVPAVLVADCRLADGETGFAVGRRFQAVFGAGLPVALVSGDTDAELQRLAAEAGWPLSRKPLQPARLRALLRRMTAAP